MTIHAAKGLEFEVVVVADLGRRPQQASPLLALAPDPGDLRVGLQLYDLAGGRTPALDRDALVGELRAADDAEEHRVHYVACTRAQELLILSGTADPAKWPEVKLGAPPIAWLSPAFLPDVEARVQAADPIQRAGNVELVRNAPDTVGTVLREAFLRPGAPPVADPLAPQPPQDELPGLVEHAGVQPPARRAAGRHAELLVAGQLRAVRVPLLPRARSAAAARRAAAERHRPAAVRGARRS